MKDYPPKGSTRKVWIMVAISATLLITAVMMAVISPYLSKDISEGRVAEMLDEENKPTPPKAEPLTDVAPPPPILEDVRRRGLPEKAKALSPPNSVVKLPEGVMDPKKPPQWTKPIARPVANPQPPDPFTPPPIRVNPERTPQPDVPRLSSGTYVDPERSPP